MPRIPFLQQKANRSPFYGPDDDVPIIVALLMGVQRKVLLFPRSLHQAINLLNIDFLAVIGGIITPTILISGAGSSFLNLDTATRQYMVSASLIVSGLMRYCRHFYTHIYTNKYKYV